LKTDKKEAGQDDDQRPTEVDSPAKHHTPPSMICVPRRCIFWHLIRSVISTSGVQAGIERSDQAQLTENEELAALNARAEVTPMAFLAK
jgi:hypothetical protein